MTGRRAMKPPGGDCHDIFGADFSGTPSHHRVLKPPGGGTSDIFNGTPGGLPSGPEPPRRMRNLQPTSKLFMDEPDHQQPPATPPKQPPTPGNGSHWRLFGPPPPSPQPSPAPKPPNARLFGTEDSPASTDGNPVTGEGYEDKNGTVSSNSSEAGSVTSSNGSGTNGMNNGMNSTPGKARGRIPPGGYSSGFW